MNIFETVKAAVTVKQAAEYCGLNVNRNNMVSCPFHNDRHPSMKLNLRFREGFTDMNIRNEIKAQIVRAGYTMQELVDKLHDEYGWSDSVSNLSAKLQRQSIRYREVVELAEALGYELIWKRND